MRVVIVLYNKKPCLDQFSKTGFFVYVSSYD
jgi:hypothetical protein